MGETGSHERIGSTKSSKKKNKEAQEKAGIYRFKAFHRYRANNNNGQTPERGDCTYVFGPRNKATSYGVGHGKRRFQHLRGVCETVKRSNQTVKKTQTCRP